jgi:hypothetical protein
MQKPDEPFREIRAIVINDEKVLREIFKTNPEVGKTPRQLIQDMVKLDIKSVVSLPSRNLYVVKVNLAERGNMDDWATLEDLREKSDYRDFAIAVNYNEYLRQRDNGGETDWDWA